MLWIYRPLSLNPKTGKPFYHTFPSVTNRDVVQAFDLLRQELRLETVHTLIGGSLGGQQVLEWAIYQPDVFQHIIPIATNANHSPWGIAFNEAQRMAIEADPTWKENHQRAGIEGLKAARAIGMISYRYYNTYNKRKPKKIMKPWRNSGLQPISVTRARNWPIVLMRSHIGGFQQ